MPKPWFEALIRNTTGLMLRLIWDIRSVEIPADDLSRLAAIRSERALVLANHPSLAEPGVMYHLISRAGVRCHLLTAWDTLFKAGWLSGRFFQWLGGYSVRRGRADRAAMDTTRKLLAAGERVLAFPEGQTYGLNDTLIPFQEGLLLIAFHALADLREQGVDAPLYLTPVAIKYVYLCPMADRIDAALTRLERALELPPAPLERYERLRRVAEAYVARLERGEELPPQPELSLDDRVLRLRDAVVTRLAAAWDAKLPRADNFPSRVLALGNAYEDRLEEQLAAGQTPARREQDPDYQAWRRLKTFLAFRDGYVAEWPSAERYADVLTRLEQDLLGRSELRGPLKVAVRVGQLVDLRDHAEAYAAQKRATLDALTRGLEAEVRSLLHDLRSHTPCLETANLEMRN